MCVGEIGYEHTQITKSWYLQRLIRTMADTPRTVVVAMDGSEHALKAFHCK